MFLIPNLRACMHIEQNKVVTLQFRMTDEKGEVLDSSENGEDLYYLHGHGNLPPKLEHDLAGRGLQETVEVTLAPDEGFGFYDESKRLLANRDQFDGVEDIHIGQQFMVDNGNSQDMYHVVEIKSDEILLDANHPFAGKTVTFNCTVTGIRDAEAEELDHGHVHGPGGHHH
jgi:FKBP-type peptidyl-prolyl cis-trans isomerase SlyD